LSYIYKDDDTPADIDGDNLSETSDDDTPPVLLQQHNDGDEGEQEMEMVCVVCLLKFDLLF
jgi:hypothetical protein